MTVETRNIIIQEALKLFAQRGYEGFSMRTLASESNVNLSSIYHFFEDKDVLLKEIFDRVSSDLGRSRSKLPIDKTASKMLYSRIAFQFDHIEEVIFVLKYYLHFRKDFLKLDNGYIPTKAYLHIEEVLTKGVLNKEFLIDPSQIEEQAKVITHAINGFLLEYYPNLPVGRELSRVIRPIHEFLIRSLTNSREGTMK
jgi:AcrR family transcriptional regulator